MMTTQQEPPRSPTSASASTPTNPFPSVRKTKTKTFAEEKEKYQNYATIQIASQKDIWSSSHSLWRKYAVKTARSPSTEGEGDVDKWVEECYPNSLDEFKGWNSENQDDSESESEGGGGVNVNSKSMKVINEIIKGGVMKNTVIYSYGGKSTGKTCLCSVFLKGFYDFNCVDENEKEKAFPIEDCILTANGIDVNNNVTEYAERINLFLAKTLKRQKTTKKTPPFLLISITGINEIKPTSQKIIHTLLQKINNKLIKSKLGLGLGVNLNLNLNFVFTTNDVKSVLDVFMRTSFLVELRHMCVTDTVELLVKCLHAKNVGYELLGVKRIVQQADKSGHESGHESWGDFKSVLKMAFDVFVKYLFLSEENATKIINENAKIQLQLQQQANRRKSLVTFVPKPDHTTSINRNRNRAREKLTMASNQSLQPLTRCTKCTLVPPCHHITLLQLSEDGYTYRASLPLNDGKNVCEGYASTGLCSVFNDTGRCKFGHPLDHEIFNITPVSVLCEVCTLNVNECKCKYSKIRNELKAFVDHSLHAIDRVYLNNGGKVEVLVEIWKRGVNRRVDEGFLNDRIEKAKEMLGKSRGQLVRCVEYIRVHSNLTDYKSETKSETKSKAITSIETWSFKLKKIKQNVDAMFSFVDDVCFEFNVMVDEAEPELVP